LAKNSITTKEFINKSIGNWKSIRSTHTLAFNEFENTNSEISIAYLDTTGKQVKDLLGKFKFNGKPEFAVSIEWESKSDWSDETQSKRDKTILVFLPSDEINGILLRSKGYLEPTHSYSEYCIDKDLLNIKTKYTSNISEEKLWFLSNNVRTRFSVIKNKQNHSIIQTSHTSEIRKLFS